MAAFWAAPEVETIAEEVIDNHHPHLTMVPVKYVFRDEAQEKAGRQIWGTARKLSGLNAYFATGGSNCFVIEIAYDIWERLEAHQREALVDHELEHCKVELTDSGAMKLSIVGHDVEEFLTILDRHGLWRPDLAKAAGSFEQAQLFTRDQ